MARLLFEFRVIIRRRNQNRWEPQKSA